MLAFRGQVLMLRAAILQPRSGCTVGEAIASIPPEIRTHTQAEALHASSRILKQDSAGYVLWQTRDGEYWAPGKDNSLFFVLSELELDPYEAGAHHLRGKVVLDCGAHLGVYTREALEAGAALVLAIEPGPRQVECLRRTFAKEIAEGRVRVLPKGVWDHDDVLGFADSVDSAIDTVMNTAGRKTIKVPLTTIDEIVADENLEHVDFIKMDIEGAERWALRGAAGTLKRFKPRLAIAAYHTIQDHTGIREIVLRENPAYSVRQVGCRLDLGVTVPLTLLFD